MLFTIECSLRDNVRMVPSSERMIEASSSQLQSCHLVVKWYEQLLIS
jgi:hypothetical protein